MMNIVNHFRNVVLGLFTLLFILSFALPTHVAAQNNLGNAEEPKVTLNGEVRHRYEADGRRVSENGKDSYTDAHFLRSRAQVTYMPTKDVRGVIQIQDSRVFGSEASTLDGSANTFDLHQGFFVVEDVLDTDFDLQVGRQEMAYANQRLVGSVGWHNVGRSFDAVRVKTNGEWGALDLFASRLGSRVNTDSVNLLDDFSSTNFYGAWSTLKFNKDHKGDFFALLDNDTREVATGPDSGSSIRNRITAGTFIRGKVSSLNYEAEFAWQGGSSQGSNTFSAILIGGKVLYASDPVKVGVLYTLLSGDDDPTDDQLKTFNTLFATNHKFYGYMDYFPGSSGAAGLQDIGVTAWLKISDAASISVDGHLFTTAVDIGTENALGKEIDATFKYRYNSSVKFTAGASIFLADDLMKGAVGGDTGWWGYLMTTVGL